MSRASRKRKRTENPSNAGDWALCLHCGRTYPRFEWTRSGQRCPHPECDGDEGDSVPWPQIREAYPDFPEIPKAGERFAPR
jgi:hypothetical protein